MFSNLGPGLVGMAERDAGTGGSTDVGRFGSRAVHIRYIYKKQL